MADYNKHYPSLDLLKRYLPVKDVPRYYNISEDTVMELIRSNKVHYAELRTPGGNRRVLQVDMYDVLGSLGRRKRLFHLENGEVADEE